MSEEKNTMIEVIRELVNTKIKTLNEQEIPMDFSVDNSKEFRDQVEKIVKEELLSLSNEDFTKGYENFVYDTLARYRILNLIISLDGGPEMAAGILGLFFEIACIESEMYGKEKKNDQEDLMIFPTNFI